MTQIRIISASSIAKGSIMKLIGSLTCPYVRKIRIILAEKNIKHEFDVDIPWNTDTHVANHNPLGKVPVLIMNDGKTLFDSRVIAEYLDDLEGAIPASRLIPESGSARWRVKRWEALADGICNATATIFLERKRPDTQQSPGWIVRQHKKIDLGLAAAAMELGGNDWCEGKTITLADIALGCATGYLAFRFPQIEWRKSYPNLTKLIDKLEQRESFISTAPRDYAS
jgi:glutathione S-transferase